MLNITSLFKNEKDNIINNNIKKYNKQNNKINYKNKICIKPWGYEFLAYETSKIGIWIIHINKNNKTSLHKHYNKDTTIIVISGCIKLNLIDNEYKLMTVFDIINIPKNKFHGIECISDNSIILELEIYNENISFSDKNDLFRINDMYNRENIGYETSITISEDLKKYNYIYFENNYSDNIYKLYNNINDILEIDEHSIFILLKGVINYNGIYIKEGSIINDYIKNSNNDEIEILQIKIPYYKENKKIIYNLDHLKLLIQEINDKHNILTSGCFDIVHIGHLEFLKNSKCLGDNLLVCLSNDIQISKLKGENRPINNYNDRINLFKTISYVDYIIIYNEENIEKEITLNNIIEIVNPYLWVKGSDYTIESIIEKHPSVNIKILQNIPNISTTHIIKNIIEKQ
jgi:D-beta-D-heptose 7-phosphate kinase/D-beta-D-heptose 1-phosphate adenosyltransferase